MRWIFSFGSMLLMSAYWLIAQGSAYAPVLRQTEAQTRLLEVFEKQNEHFLDFSRYTPNIANFEIQEHGPNPGHNLYIIGVPADCVELKSLASSENISAVNLRADVIPKIVEMKELLNSLIPVQKCESEFSGNQLFAVGYIGGDKFDVWQITEEKEIKNIQNGLPSDPKKDAFREDAWANLKYGIQKLKAPSSR